MGIEICTSWLGFPLVVDLVFAITPMLIAMAWFVCCKLGWVVVRFGVEIVEIGCFFFVPL